jgi:hypothetical protein
MITFFKCLTMISSKTKKNKCKFKMTMKTLSKMLPKLFKMNFKQNKISICISKIGKYLKILILIHGSNLKCLYLDRTLELISLNRDFRI